MRGSVVKRIKRFVRTLKLVPDVQIVNGGGTKVHTGPARAIAQAKVAHRSVPRPKRSRLWAT